MESAVMFFGIGVEILRERWLLLIPCMLAATLLGHAAPRGAEVWGFTVLCFTTALVLMYTDTDTVGMHYLSLPVVVSFYVLIPYGAGQLWRIASA